MKQFLDALTALLKVKTIVTLVIIVVLAVLSLNGSVEPDKFLTIATMVVAFYFGRRIEKKVVSCPHKIHHFRPGKDDLHE